MNSHAGVAVFRSTLGSSRKMLLAILVLSLALRLTTALYLGNNVDPLPGIHDQVSYHALAVRILDGCGFSFNTNWWPATSAGAPTAFWSYLYTSYLALVYALFGASPLVARIIQVVLVAVLHPLLAWRIGNRLFGNDAGLAAALLTTVYGYFVYYAGSLVTEALFIVSVLWSLDVATKMLAASCKGQETRRVDWLLLGLATGTAILLRQAYLLFVPVLLGWLIVRLWQNGVSCFKGVIVVSVTLLLLILPWTARNYSAFGRFVLLNTNAGFAFFWGNHPIHGSSFKPILRGDASYGSLIPARFRGLDEASLDRALLREGVRFVTEDPQRYLFLSMSRAKEYFKFWPSRESSVASNLVRVFSFGLLLPLMAFGLIGEVHRGFLRQRPWDLTRIEFPIDGQVLLVLFVFLYSVMHLLSWALVRYRLPVDSVLMLFAGVGAIQLLNGLTHKVRAWKRNST